MKTLLLLSASVVAMGHLQPAPESFGCRESSTPEAARLIALSETVRCWMTEDEIRVLHQNNTGFVDDTDGLWTEGTRLGKQREALRLNAKTYPSAPAFASVVKAATAKVNPNDLKTKLTEFVNKFTTRHKTSSQGLASSKWLYEQVAALSNSHGRKDIKTTAKTYDHGWGQLSVILRIDPVATPAKNDILILGAHQDSINQRGGTAAPGADDDASGTITNFQALKILLSTPEWVPTRPIEYHWYSAEETGLQGSKQIAAAYAKQKVDVYAMFQLDMTGWNRGGTKVISFTDDYTTLPLTEFLEKCTKAYLTTKPSRNTCGYGCSDHAAWYNAGYPTVYPFEEDGAINPNIHSTKDTISTLDFNHMAEFTRLSIAFTVELSQKAIRKDWDILIDDPVVVDSSDDHPIVD